MSKDWWSCVRIKWPASVRFPASNSDGRDFLTDLDAFLANLPPDWPYAIELRNKPWLTPEYFACLAKHRVTHVFNSWEAMPSVPDQMALPDSRTNPNRLAARFLLKPGRKYEQAVKAFEPYDRVQEPYPDARAAGAQLIREGLTARGTTGGLHLRQQPPGRQRPRNH